ncbi:TonB-dependent vitamin B12 receptor [Marinobacterium sediminicola]|nr:TonB-dependent vitamin B12 receptor [Marinobacterium sediminicola]ULG69418.1 TonB-dependent vitamin B12 receptor [Marinobacterium sediminicola]
MKQLSIPVALLLGTSVMAVQAQTNPDTLLVTATRTAQTADQALASVTVIDREEIERKQAQTVTELLAQTPGVVVTNNGGRGKNTSIFLRGTSSDHLLVMIDGVKAGSATSGGFSFQHLSPDQIERIEIVRGPRSSLYGSEAVGGVIQIFTRKGKEGFKPRFSVGAGSDDSREVTLGVSGGNDQGWYNLGVSDYSTDGIDVKTADISSHEPDDDGYDNRSYTLSGGYRFNEMVEAQLHWSQSRGDSDYDSYYDYSSTPEAEPMTNWNDKSRVQSLGGSLILTPLDGWNVKLSGGRTTDVQKHYDHGVYQYDYETERDTVSLQSEHLISQTSQLTWGVDYQQDKVSSESTVYDVTSRDNKGVFGLYQLYLGQHDLAFSLRHDNNEQFGEHTTGSVAWGVELPRNFRLTASYGTAFSAPTFNDLYWPNAGDEDLEPEESESIEIGLSGDHAGVQWFANLYQTDIESLISGWPPANVSEARIRGLELAASTQLLGWNVSAGLDLMDPKNLANDIEPTQKDLLLRRARKVFRFSADRDFGAYSFGGTLQAIGVRHDEIHPKTNVRLAGYTTVDLRGSYALGNDWSLKAKVENLLDEDYQTARGYNQPDRTYWLSLHYAP